MPFMERRVYVEFIGKNTVQIVTSLNNRTFTLKDECTIDLLTLKREVGIRNRDNPPSDFYMTFEIEDNDDRGIDEEWLGATYARVKEGEIKIVALYDWRKRNKQVLKLKVWYD